MYWVLKSKNWNHLTLGLEVGHKYIQKFIMLLVTYCDTKVVGIKTCLSKTQGQLPPEKFQFIVWLFIAHMWMEKRKMTWNVHCWIHKGLFKIFRLENWTKSKRIRRLKGNWSEDAVCRRLYWKKEVCILILFWIWKKGYKFWTRKESLLICLVVPI